MSAASIALMGAIAGFTIFLGLPIGRVRATMPRTKTLLNAFAIGILLFLLWDVLSAAWEPVDSALGGHDWARVVGTGAVMAVAFGVGLMGLVYFDRGVARRRAASAARAATATSAADGVAEPVPVAAASAAGVAGHNVAPASGPVLPAGGATLQPASGTPVWRTAAGELALLIAIGIGLHNFAEGLAIGNSAAAGKLSLALLLVIGFAAHNATEGFGIVAPLAAAGVRPSWVQLGLLGLIGGGPTLVGTLVGQVVVNDVLSVAFLALAAGSILYVVMELLAVARRLSAKEWTCWGLIAGLVAGFATDAILAAAGA